MATTTLKGVNRTYRTSTPPTKIPAGEERGKVHWYYDEYSWSTNSVIGDIVTMMTIPNGARVIGGTIKCNDWGTAGQMDLGYAASADGTEAADDDAFFNEFNPETTGGNVGMIGQGATGADGAAPGAGLFKKFAADVNVILTVTEASNVGTGATVQVGIAVVFD